MFVWIQPDGAVRFVYDDALHELLVLGQPTIRRASHVEPTPDGQWTADLGPMEGPVLGPFETRAAALDAERAWLVRHFTAGHPGIGDRSCDPNPSRPPPPRPGIRPTRGAVTVHAHLTALPGLLAEADLAEAHVEARDRRTGALVAYSFVTIHRALALQVAEAVRAALARLDLEAGRHGVGQDSGRAAEAVDAEAPVSSDHRPGQYL